MSNQPVIGIVGGVRADLFKNEDVEADKILACYGDACKDLGASLADAGMRLLVWSSDSRFIETDVVEGYLSSENVKPSSIVCVWNRDFYPSFPRQDEENGPILLKQSPYDDWEVGFYESIREEAQGIILIGGGPTTLVAGVVAASWGKALFTTPHFRGKAETLYKWIHTGSPLVADSPISPQDLDLMSRPWSADSCVKSIGRQLAERDRLASAHSNRQGRYEMLEEKLSQQTAARRGAWVVMTALLAFVAAMVAAISIADGILDLIAFFSLLVFGGALGSSLGQLGLRRESSLPAWPSALVGAGLGIIVGVVQMAPNVANLFGQNPLKVDTGLIFSSAVFALLGGLAFESTLQNLVSRGRNIAADSPGVEAGRPSLVSGQGEPR